MTRADRLAAALELRANDLACLAAGLADTPEFTSDYPETARALGADALAVLALLDELAILRGSIDIPTGRTPRHGRGGDATGEPLTSTRQGAGLTEPVGSAPCHHEEAPCDPV